MQTMQSYIHACVLFLFCLCAISISISIFTAPEDRVSISSMMMIPFVSVALLCLVGWAAKGLFCTSLSAISSFLFCSHLSRAANPSIWCGYWWGRSCAHIATSPALILIATGIVHILHSSLTSPGTSSSLIFQTSIPPSLPHSLCLGHPPT